MQAPKAPLKAEGRPAAKATQPQKQSGGLPKDTFQLPQPRSANSNATSTQQQAVADRARTSGLGGAFTVSDTGATHTTAQMREALAPLLGGQLSFVGLPHGERSLENNQLRVSDGTYRTNVNTIGASDDAVVRAMFEQLTQPGSKVIVGLSDPEVQLQWSGKRFDFISGDADQLTKALAAGRKELGLPHTMAEMRTAIAPLFGGALTFGTSAGGAKFLENNFVAVSDGQYRTNVAGFGKSEDEAVRSAFESLTREGTTVGVMGSDVKLQWTQNEFKFVSGDARALAEAIANASRPPR
jgi:hypothetical protein